MTPDELRQQCLRQQAFSGRDDALVTLTMPGRWGKREQCRLWPGGPLARIVGETHDNTVVVMAHADKILAAPPAAEPCCKGGRDTADCDGECKR